MPPTKAHDLLQVASNVALAIQLAFESRPELVTHMAGDDKAIEVEFPSGPPPHDHLIIRFTARTERT